MLLRGITWLVLFQLIGTGLNVLLLPGLPGPIIGMLLLFIWLLLQGEVSPAVSEAAGSLLRYLPLLLIPAAAGILSYADQLRADFWALAATLVLSLLPALLFCGWLMQKLIGRQQRREEAGHD